jgi:hypothetical protein
VDDYSNLSPTAIISFIQLEDMLEQAKEPYSPLIDQSKEVCRDTGVSLPFLGMQDLVYDRTRENGLDNIPDAVLLREVRRMRFHYLNKKICQSFLCATEKDGTDLDRSVSVKRNQHPVPSATDPISVTAYVDAPCRPREKQKNVLTKGSTEAELIMNVLGKVVWTRRFILKQGCYVMGHRTARNFFIDKYIIKIRNLFVKGLFDDGDLTVTFLPTAVMVADIDEEVVTMFTFRVLQGTPGDYEDELSTKCHK